MINSTLYNGASLEMDFYGGYKATFGDFGLDIGTIYYFYPRDRTEIARRRRQELGRVYVGGTWGHAKYFYSFTGFFGLNSGALGLPGGINTKGSPVPRPPAARSTSAARCRRPRRLAEGQRRRTTRHGQRQPLRLQARR